MWDFFFRALRHPFDYIGITRRHTLTLIEKTDLGQTAVLFRFKPERPLAWKAGQHGLFVFKGKKMEGNNWRPFSICSSTADGTIDIATQISETPSQFKAALNTLPVGGSFTMYGPYGEFHLHGNHTLIVGIAGGIGITPFLSMMQELAAGVHGEVTFHLIYAGKEGFYCFKKECDELMERARNIHITYVSNRDDVTAAVDAAIKTHGNKAEYFISGSPGMITGIGTTLKKAGIKRVVYDPFKAF